MFALNFLQACIASLLTGAAAWGILRGATRLWPGLAARRSPWLLAACAVAASLSLALLPPSARLGLIPALELPGSADAASHAPPAMPASASTASGEDGGSDDHGSADVQPNAALTWLGNGWLAVYVLGVALAGRRWLHARRALTVLLASSRPLGRADLAAHAGFADEVALPPVRETDAALSPMLVGMWRPTLLLPRHLRDFDPVQQRLVIAHELTHMTRRDHLWLHLGFVLQTVLWFNPAVAMLRRQLAWAQELGCDRAVLHGRPAALRRSYAAALVAQLRMQGASEQLACVHFGGRLSDSVAARIGMIRDGVPALPRAAAALCWATLPAALLASLALQPALAWRAENVPAASHPHHAPPAAPEQAHWQAPMAKLRVSSFFGVAHLTGKPHAGMDFAAPAGTPVTAVDAGTVLASTNRFKGQAKYGEVVEIAHDNGLRSMYAHLERRTVKVGERVAAGQQIGAAGATGKATGPHLHLEATRNGQPVDPQEMLGNLEANATASALKNLHANRH